MFIANRICTLSFDFQLFQLLYVIYYLVYCVPIFYISRYQFILPILKAFLYKKLKFIAFLRILVVNLLF